MTLWKLHSQLETCILLLKEIEVRAHDLSVTLPLWIIEKEMKIINDVFSKLIEKKFYA